MLVKTRLAKSLCALGTAALPVALYAFSSGPPIKRSGVPADGGLVCTACHVSEGPANSDPRGRFTIQAGPYTPGVKQTITVALVHPTALRWGFQLTARLASDESKQAGTFTVNPAIRVRCDPDGRNAPCDGALEFVEHTVGSTRAGQAQWNTWTIEWTPPATEVGDVVFYAAGNAANNNNANTGDHIYSTKVRVYSSTGCRLTGTPAVSGVLNAASFDPSMSVNTLVSIFGSGFAPAGTERSAHSEDLVNYSAYPKQLNCVAVEIDGQRAPITYVRPNQINAQVPTLNDLGQGNVQVILNPGQPNEIRMPASRSTPLQLYSPAFFTFDGRSVSATDPAGKLVANPAVLASGTPAHPGDVVVLYGTGFGVTNPVYQAGELVPSLAALRDPFQVIIGGVTLAPADVLYAGLAPASISGLYQFNVRIPPSVGDGDIPVSITLGSYKTQAGATIPVKR